MPESLKDRFKAAQKSGGAKDLGIQFIRFDKEGVEVLGLYLSKAIVEGGKFKGQYFQYIFSTDDGPVKCHMGGAFDSEYAEMLEKGELYFIRFDGSETIDENKVMKRYTVKHIPQTLDR